MMDLLVLRHPNELGTKATTLRIMTVDRAPELVQRAVPGDTLHKVPADFSNNVPGIFDWINDQLTRQDFVKV